MRPHIKNSQAQPRFFLLMNCRSRTRNNGEAVVGFGSRTSRAPWASSTFESSDNSESMGRTEEGRKHPSAALTLDAGGCAEWEAAGAEDEAMAVGKGEELS
mmetsp:Transcript_71869/g.232800  ORF Transcript_71869/g.232800 Transcript_71869/m.232800 type:complete len:101 (+) Transcript_71869:414-716(+)